MLDALNRQGKFGEDYVRVLASAAGLVVSTYSVDVDGVDLGIMVPNAAHGWSPQIAVQVKTTSVPTWRGGHLVFDGLNQVQFNKLAGADFTVPRYLFVVIVPPDADEYTAPISAGMLLRNLGYFVSLHDRGKLAEPDTRRHVRVEVPIANVLTTTAIRRLIESGSRLCAAI
ncbi:hypothetical protein BJF78_16505 [Pseudonocardia sp. CNS-139]|nr:hypothetical protein BJF78_16505 [Pseudonocardia sp. CNS-139]